MIKDVDLRDQINPNCRKNFRIDVSESAIVMEQEDSFYYAATVKNISLSGIGMTVVNKCNLKEGTRVSISLCGASDNPSDDLAFEFDATVVYTHKYDSMNIYVGCKLNVVPIGLKEFITSKQLEMIKTVRKNKKNNPNISEHIFTEDSKVTIDVLKPGNHLVIVTPKGNIGTRYYGKVLDSSMPIFKKLLPKVTSDMPIRFIKYEKIDKIKIDPNEVKYNFVYTVDSVTPYRWDKARIFTVPINGVDNILMVQTGATGHYFDQRRAKRYQTQLSGTLQLNNSEDAYNIDINDISLIGTQIVGKDIPDVYLGNKGRVSFEENGNMHRMDIQIVRLVESESSSTKIGCVITSFHDDVGSYLSRIPG